MLFHVDTYVTLIQKLMPEANEIHFESLEVFLLGLFIWFDFCLFDGKKTLLIYLQQYCYLKWYVRKKCYFYKIHFLVFCNVS